MKFQPVSLQEKLLLAAVRGRQAGPETGADESRQLQGAMGNLWKSHGFPKLHGGFSWIFHIYDIYINHYWSILVYCRVTPFSDCLEHTCAADSWWRGMLLGSIGVGAVWETKDYLLLWSVVNVDVFVQETYRRFPVSLHQLVVDESLEC